MKGIVDVSNDQGNLSSNPTCVTVKNTFRLDQSDIMARMNWTTLQIVTVLLLNIRISPNMAAKC